MKITNEVKTGIIVVAAAAVGIFFFVKTTDFSDKPYRVKTNFTNADGIKVDSIVKLSGVDVGRVEAIAFSYESGTKVELTLLVNRQAKLREDSVAFISQSGLIGDAYVGITAGSADKGFLQPGAVLSSEDPVEMRKIMRRAESIAENLDQTIIQVKALSENLNGVVSENKGKVSSIMTNLDGMLKDNKTKVDMIASNLEETTENFKEFSADIKAHPWKLLSKGKD